MEAQSTRVVTGKVRFCYANVFQPRASEEGKSPKYSVCILIPKSDTATVAKINAAVEAAKIAGKQQLTDKSGKFLANLKHPLRDGDVDRPDDLTFKGCYFINAKSARKPSVVDRDLQEIIDPDAFYSGCYGRASLGFFAFNMQGSKGIAAGLNNLQKLEDGESLMGGSSAAEDFGGANAVSSSAVDELM